MSILTLSSGLLDLVYPENIYCACCGDTMESSRIHGICDKCAAEINWLQDNPFRSSMEQFSFDELIACCVYGFFPRRIIHKFKLGGCRYLAKPLGRLMADRVHIYCKNKSPKGLFDCICFVPASKEKLRKRSYNQAELLAKEISRELQTELLPLLIKPEETPSMRLSAGWQRRTLLEDAFDVNPKTKSPEGLSILLIDDVLTTGSTASECARTLKAAGAKKVTALVFASSSGSGYYYHDEDPEWSFPEGD